MRLRGGTYSTSRSALTDCPRGRVLDPSNRNLYTNVPLPPCNLSLTPFCTPCSARGVGYSSRNRTTGRSSSLAPVATHVSGQLSFGVRPFSPHTTMQLGRLPPPLRDTLGGNGEAEDSMFPHGVGKGTIAVLSLCSSDHGAALASFPARGCTYFPPSAVGDWGLTACAPDGCVSSIALSPTGLIAVGYSSINSARPRVRHHPFVVRRCFVRSDSVLPSTGSNGV